jgi:NAD(P)H-dependent FMN reductase
MRILAFAASLRRGSLNRKLISVAAEEARSAGAEVDLADFREFELPIYDGDVDATSGIPPGGAPTLAERLRKDVVGFVRLAEAVSSVCSTTPPPEERPRQAEIAAALEEESELQPPSR